MGFETFQLSFPFLVEELEQARHVFSHQIDTVNGKRKKSLEYLAGMTTKAESPPLRLLSGQTQTSQTVHPRHDGCLSVVFSIISALPP
jgi:hypothetical protein